MELILWRHADAEDGITDAERKLTAKGLEQAENMADWLKERLPKETVVLASPAKRALQTARALSAKFETRPELATGAAPQAVLEAAGWPHGAGAVVVVGHQPTLGQAAALLLAGAAAEWSIKKGAVWWIAHRVRHGRPETVLRAVMSPELL